MFNFSDNFDLVKIFVVNVFLIFILWLTKRKTPFGIRQLVTSRYVFTTFIENLVIQNIFSVACKLNERTVHNSVQNVSKTSNSKELQFYNSNIFFTVFMLHSTRLLSAVNHEPDVIVFDLKILFISLTGMWVNFT